MFPNLFMSFLIDIIIIIDLKPCKTFLKGQMLWWYVTSYKKQPGKNDHETNDVFADSLEVWDATNHLITWFTNASIPSIGVIFRRYNMAKEAWDFLQQRYS